MINLEEIFKKIEEDFITEKTTKELKQTGLNDYYIKKACENGFLEKISRGKYKVTDAEKNKKRVETFNAFVRAIFSNDYESAYEELLINIKNQNRLYNYDCHIKLYSIMLKELLPNKDFSFIDDFDVTYENYNDEAYYHYFIEFIEAVLKRNFEKAYKVILLYRNEEKAANKVYRLSTKLFTHLAYNIQNQSKNISKETPKNINQEGLRIAAEKRKNYLYKENYTNLIKNIEAENYEEALFNLENALKYALPKAVDNLKKIEGILTKYLEIKSSKKPLPVQEIDYEEYQDNYIKIFNKALELKDYQTAYKNIGKCVYFNKTSKTLQLYRSLLHALIEENNKNMKNNSVTTELAQVKVNKEIRGQQVIEKESKIKKPKELTKSQKSIILKHILSQEDFEQLENATLEKIRSSVDDDTSYDEYIIEMLEMLRNIEEYKLNSDNFGTLKNISEFSPDSTSFKRFEYSEKEILDKFLEAIRLGDYQEAYQISIDKKWYQEMKKSANKDYLIIYKKLLFRINKKIEDNSKIIEVPLNEEPFEEKPLLEQLETLRSLVKKRKLITAYKYYQENELEGINNELDLILQTFFHFIKMTVNNESIEIENKYKTALNRGDYEEAIKNIKEYEEFIKFNDLDRNIDYHKARIDAKKLEIDTPDFVEKEQLYDTAHYYFKKRQFEKAIEVLDEYISKDNDISPKGYFLRGKSYEWSKQFQEAKSDYEKALSIAPEPNVYHRLGKINYYSGDYEKALECFLEYEARRPNLHVANLEALSNTYQALGQDELSEKYKKLIKVSTRES